MTQISLDSAAARLLAAAAHARVNPAREPQRASEDAAHGVLAVVDRDLLIVNDGDIHVIWASAIGDDVVGAVAACASAMGPTALDPAPRPAAC